MSLEGKSRRGDKMNEEMTNLEFISVIKLIIQLIRDTDDKEELIKKIEVLIK